MMTSRSFVNPRLAAMLLDGSRQRSAVPRMVRMAGQPSLRSADTFQEPPLPVAEPSPTATPGGTPNDGVHIPNVNAPSGLGPWFSGLWNVDRSSQGPGYDTDMTDLANGNPPADYGFGVEAGVQFLHPVPGSSNAGNTAAGGIAGEAGRGWADPNAGSLFTSSMDRVMKDFQARGGYGGAPNNMRGVSDSGRTMFDPVHGVGALDPETGAVVRTTKPAQLGANALNLLRLYGGGG